MSDGFLLLDKPAGPTAHDVVSKVRRALGVRRVGHTGTLDPFATGLLVVLVGRLTRLAQFLVHADKRYTGVIRLGETTDTLDGTGTVVESSDGWQTVSDDRIGSAMRDLTGRYQQRPPVYSAKKVGGERAYRLARRGKHVDLAPREVEVFEFTLQDRSGPNVRFECAVSSGTYVRALARDLGAALHCGAHLRELRRESVGEFSVRDAIPAADLERGPPALRPPLEAVGHMPQLVIDPEQRHLIVHGRSIAVGRAMSGPVALVADGELVAVAEPRGEQLKPSVVLEG